MESPCLHFLKYASIIVINEEKPRINISQFYGVRAAHHPERLTTGFKA
jgi:hypothetical protein